MVKVEVEGAVEKTEGVVVAEVDGSLRDRLGGPLFFGIKYVHSTCLILQFWHGFSPQHFTFLALHGKQAFKTLPLFL